MSKRAYVLVKRGKVVEVARPLQGHLQVYQPGDSFISPLVDYTWEGDGVWFVRLYFRRLKARVMGGTKPKKVNVTKKIATIEQKWGGDYTRAGTSMPGIKGYQHRADASASAQRSRKREADNLLKWLRGLDEGVVLQVAERPMLFESITTARDDDAHVDKRRRLAVAVAALTEVAGHPAEVAMLEIAKRLGLPENSFEQIDGQGFVLEVNRWLIAVADPLGNVIKIEYGRGPTGKSYRYREPYNVPAMVKRIRSLMALGEGVVLSEAKMPKPVSGGFTIKASARGDKIPVDVIKAQIFDNTWALEKANKAWFVFHIPSGLQVGEGRLRTDAIKVVQAAYDIAPPDAWQFTSIETAPRALTKALLKTVMDVKRTVTKLSVAVESNRKLQLAGVRRDELGWAKKAMKTIVATAKRAAEREILAAFYAGGDSAGKPDTTVYQTVAARLAARGRYTQPDWPSTMSGAGKATVYDYDASYGGHGIERGVDRGFLTKLSGTKRAAMTVKPPTRRGVGRKYKLVVRVADAHWNDDSTDPAHRKRNKNDPSKVLAAYTWTATRV